MKAFQRTSSATDMRFQGTSSATDTEKLRKTSSAVDEKIDSGKTNKVEKGEYYGTREE